MPEQTFIVGNMDCAHCAQEVETGVGRLDGVKAVRVDFATGKMLLSGDIPFEILQQRVESLGKTVVLDDGSKKRMDTTPGRGGVVGFWDYLIARKETRLAVAGGAGILLTLVLSLAAIVPEAISNVMYTVSMLTALYPIARSGINALRINHQFNINLLMSIAAIGAIILGEYLESATVIFLFAIGESLEGYTADRARDSLRGLVALMPTTALRLLPDGEELIDVDLLHVGDHIIVKPGERIPMDGVVSAGQSAVNQAPITGESLPVEKSQDDTLFAGTINGDGMLTIEVTRLAADNTLARIVQLVEEAQSVRAPSQRLIDQFAHYYTPAIVVIAAFVAVIPPLLFNAPFYDTPETTGWLYRALTILVIGCPCALVISTPVTVISAITSAARHGVLIKGGAHLESLAQVRAFAFDKTGTLTQGTPAVTAIRSVDCLTDDECESCLDVLALASAVERRSTHPLAQAVVHAAAERKLESTYTAAENIRVLAGRGIQGTVDGKLITLGSHGLFDDQMPHAEDFCSLVDAAEGDGQTTMLLSDGDRVRGFIALSDTARSDSQQVIHDLNAMNLKTVMLTGDNQTVAQSIGNQIGVQDIRAGLLPEDKVTAVRELMADHSHVAMVGDGVNDTPALAAATVGIAMGGAGTAQALETADIALMSDDLKQLPYAVRLAQFARSLIKQNVVLSFGLKLAFLLLALMGGVTMWMAVFADVGMSLIVTLNGMRPLRKK